jgi:hypothetical protein
MVIQMMIRAQNERHFWRKWIPAFWLIVVSGWVENRLGTVKLVKVARSGLVIIFCISSIQREHHVTRDKICDLLCSPEQCAFEKSDYWGDVKCCRATEIENSLCQ